MKISETKKMIDEKMRIIDKNSQIIHDETNKIIEEIREKLDELLVETVWIADMSSQILLLESNGDFRGLLDYYYENVKLFIDYQNAEFVFIIHEDEEKRYLLQMSFPNYKAIPYVVYKDEDRVDFESVPFENLVDKLSEICKVVRKNDK